MQIPIARDYHRIGGGRLNVNNGSKQREPTVPYYVAISLWMLDDFTETNEATRVVPSFHHKYAHHSSN